jgi:hypothetical protein
MKITKLKPRPCPYCGYSLNAASNPNGDTPEPGDITMCSDCRNWLEFGEDMELLKTSNQRINEANKEDRISLKNFIEKYFND